VPWRRVERVFEWWRFVERQAPSLRWQDVAVGLGLASVVFALLWGARCLARRHHRLYASTVRSELLEWPALVASRTTTPFLLIVATFVAFESFDLNPRLDATIRTVVMVAAFWQAGLWASTLAMAWLDRHDLAHLGNGKAKAGSIGILRFGARAVIWAMVVLLTLENLGTDITALVAGLGIGGVAVALALQNVLGDLLASLSITLDRPFVVGDFIASGTNLGTVEYIGIKSTRLRSLEGEQIVMPNSELLSHPLRNYGRMSERRVVFSLRVAYETPAEQLARLPEVVRGTVESHADVRFDRCHVAGLEESWVRIEAVYYVTVADYNRHMDLQQSIYLQLLRDLVHSGVEVAYPVRRVCTREPDPAAGRAV
jgi:small-conductance mechanosensitive channel